MNLHDPRVWAVFIAGYDAGIRDGIDIGHRAGWADGRAALLDELLTDEPLPLVPGVWHGPSRTELARRRREPTAPRTSSAPAGHEEVVGRW